CTLVNAMTSPGHWWVQWVAMGLAIAVIVKLGRALRTLIVAGTLTALAIVAWRWWKQRSARTA
ncbi:MAG TPA: hypothetical protein VFV17_07425, partial [Usitatibacteraceae bacterium]|nr:hypothetical protein [Usitatibacteraceae bacterium]